MGYTSFHTGTMTAAERKATLLQVLHDEKIRIIDIGVSGTTYYTLTQNVETGHTYAEVILTSIKKGEFCYKVMDESRHPFSYDCPKRILDKLPPTDNELANEWRQKCRERLASKRNGSKLENGSTIRFDHTIEFTNETQSDTFILTLIPGKKRNRTLFQIPGQPGLYRIPNWKKLEYEIVK